MERMKASDFSQEVLDLFDLLVHGDIDRRGFVDRAAKFTAGGVTAAAVLDMLSPNYAWAQQVPKDDKRIKASYEMYPSPNGNSKDGKMKGYLVRPASASGKLPGVMVVHENRGLNPYIEDVARRLGTAGFMAFAPDALTPLGGYPGDDTKGQQMQSSLDGKKMTEDFAAAVTWLKSRPDCTGKVGVVGFCYGGGIANQMAVRFPDLAAAVPFYGAQPSAEDAAKIKAPLLLHYAELDTRLTGGWPAYEAALKANNKTYQVYIYKGANHGFHNDTTPRYDKAAAEEAWQRTIEWFNKYLKS